MDYLKTFEAIGNNFYALPALKKLACRGSANSETVCFKLERYIGNVDLYGCYCTIKTKNSEGKSDLIIPNVTADDKKMQVIWTLSSGTTAAAGQLQVQLQFEKIFSDKSQNIIWQSNIIEFEIADSLDAADVIADKDPTLFQQWEDKVNTLYSDVASDLQSVKALQSQVKADADTVTQQKQSIDQTAVQVTQNAQAASKSEHNSAISEANAQTSATQAQTCAADANTAQGLAKGYSDAAKTYSDATAVSAQSAQESAQTAQQQAKTAQETATQAQQKVDAFSGYTKEEINNGFANALVGNQEGISVALDDFQENSNFRSLILNGSAEGITQVEITVSGKNLLHASQGTITANGVAFTVSEDGTIILDGTSSVEQWILISPYLQAAPPEYYDWLVKSIGTDYTLSCEVLSGSVTGTVNICFKNDIAKIDGVSMNTKLGSLTKQIAANSGITRFWLNVVKGSVFDHYTFRVQLEQSSQKTDWEPYSGIALYEAVPSASLMAGDTYDLVSGLETHANKTIFQHDPLSIPENKRVAVNTGTLSVTYTRGLNKVIQRLESALAS